MDIYRNRGVRASRPEWTGTDQAWCSVMMRRCDFDRWRIRRERNRTRRHPPFARWTASLLVALTTASNAVGVARAEPAPGFVSVMFGRMQWTTTDHTCAALPATIDLGTVKRALDARRIRATGIVITSWTAKDRFRCLGGTHVPE